MKSATRLMAVMRKELRQLKRDRVTFAMIVGIPVMQMPAGAEFKPSNGVQA